MLVQALYRQYLIAQKNSLQYNLLQNYDAQRAMIRGQHNPNFLGSLEFQNTLDSIQLMAINSELNALNDCKMNYLA